MGNGPSRETSVVPGEPVDVRLRAIESTLDHRLASNTRAIVIAIVTVILLGSVVAFYMIGAYNKIAATHSAADAAVQAANAATEQSKTNARILEGQVADKNKVITDKDALLAQKDQALAGQTNIIGQLYNAAVALQGQVRQLGGQPKSIPITLPQQPSAPSSKALITPGSTPVPSSVPRVSVSSKCLASIRSGILNTDLVCP